MKMEYKSELTELFRARDASCPKGKKMRMNDMGREKRLIFGNFLSKAI